MEEARNYKLHEACEQLNVEQVRQILENGNFDVNAKNEMGRTPLHLTIQTNLTKGVPGILLKPFTFLTGQQTMTPTSHNNKLYNCQATIQITKLLLLHGADPSIYAAPNSGVYAGKTAFDYLLIEAVMYAHYATTNELKANKETQYFRYKELIELFINSGKIDVNYISQITDQLSQSKYKPLGCLQSLEGYGDGWIGNCGDDSNSILYLLKQKHSIIHTTENKNKEASSFQRLGTS